MRTRSVGSNVAYGVCILSGVIGVGLCCFFGFGEVSSPSVYNIGYVALAILMIMLMAFGYRGITEQRKLGNEIWWQLLIAGLIWAVFLTLFVIFVFTWIAVLSGGRTTVF